MFVYSDDDDDAEPVIPLLLRDKQGRHSLSDGEGQRSSKSDETVNQDRYRELPEWVPEFYPSDTAKDSPCEPVRDSALKEEKPISFTARKSVESHYHLGVPVIRSQK